jgi:hypothetical protein
MKTLKARIASHTENEVSTAREGPYIVHTVKPSDSAVRVFLVRLLHNPLHTVYLHIKGEDEQMEWLKAPTFSIQAVHHAANKLQLVLKAEIDKIGVDKDSVRRNKGRVVVEEKR